VGDPPLDLWHHEALQHPANYSENGADGYVHETVQVYSRPPAIVTTYKMRTVIQVVNAVVEREPAQWRSWTWAPRNKAIDMQFAEWVEGKPYSR
jgi:hypothetical protein